MKHLSDKELIDELKRRLEESSTLRKMLDKLTEKLKDLNQKLIESEELKSRFLSNIRNEINNPLTVILCLAENLMSEPTPDTKKVKQCAKMIYKEASNLDFQLQTIFAAAEMEAGEVQIHISEIDIIKMIHQIIQFFSTSAHEKELEIHFNNQLGVHSSEPFIFKTDAEKFHLILSNLISNGITYSHKGNRLEIEAWIDNRDLKILVQDFGIGIDEADYQRIFDRFVQLDSGSAKKYKGHGLGLSVAKEAVELLGGSISVSSQKGEGSIFMVSIPEAQTVNEVDFWISEMNKELF